MNKIAFAFSGAAAGRADLNRKFMVLAIPRQRGSIESDLVSVSHQQRKLFNYMRGFLAAAWKGSLEPCVLR